MKLIFAAILAVICAVSAQAQHLERVSPLRVGMDINHFKYADSVITSAIGDKMIPGAVLAVVRKGKMAYLKAYGNRSVEPDSVAMEVNTVFDIASCSKPLSTATSTMILVDRGQIRLLDMVSFYLPNFKSWRGEDGKRRSIRIIDLLTHTSGLPAYVDMKKIELEHGVGNSSGLLDYISDCDRLFEPQTDFKYSCLNYIVLQHIIEMVSGSNLRTFAKSNIFEPLGMHHTDYIPTHRDSTGIWTTPNPPTWMDRIAPTERQPNGQILRGQVHDPIARISNSGVSGNAGLFSTAEDMALMAMMFMRRGEYNGVRILSPLAVRTMTTVPSHIDSLGRAPGWDVFSAYASNKGDLVSGSGYGHSGYTGTSIVIDPENDLAIILLTNCVHPTNGKSIVRLRSLVANCVAAAVVY